MDGNTPQKSAVSLWPKANAGAGNVANWIGVYTGVSAILSWIAKKVTWLGDPNWAEAIFVGLGVAGVLSLVLSVTLIAIRYFRPLRELSPEAPLDAIPNGDEAQIGLGELAVSVECLESNVRQLTGKLESLGDTVEANATSIENHKWSLLAIYHRERMLDLASRIDESGFEVGLRHEIDKQFTEAEFEEWGTKFLAWRALLGQWCRYASFYLGRDPQNEIERIDESGLRENWGVSAEQFPSEGLVRYKTFRIYFRNWSNIRDVIHQKVKMQAFEGQQHNTRQHYGN